MSTLAEITTAIDDNIRNKTPLVVKTEHADVEQLIADQLFPDSVKIQWNGTSSVDPITDILVSTSTLPNTKCLFELRFTKLGNRVFYKGIIAPFAGRVDINNAQLGTFATDLYKPDVDHTSRSIIIIEKAGSESNVLPNAIIIIDSVLGIKVQGFINQGSAGLYFEGSYKVEN